MALALDNNASWNEGGALVQTYTHSYTCTGSDLGLIVKVSLRTDAGITVTGVTYVKGSSVTAMILEDQQTSGDGGTQVYIFTMIAPDTGAHDIVVTKSASGATNEVTTHAESWTDVHQTTSWSTADGASGTEAGNLNPAHGQTISSGEILTGIANGRRTALTLTAGAGDTELSNVTNNLTPGYSSYQAGSGAIDLNCTKNTATEWAYSVIAIKPTAVAAGAPLAGSLGGMGVGW